MAKTFLATLGRATAVVTETLWALNQRVPTWIPDRIEIVTTRTGAQDLMTHLLVSNGPLVTLFGTGNPIPPIDVFVPLRELSSPTVQYTRLQWRQGCVQFDIQGNLDHALADVDDEAAAMCMGDLILDRVRSAKQRRSDELHLSISGGRKTMSAHALFSLGLVGDIRDEASHVLMGAEFENNRHFWHPDQGGMIHTVADQIAYRSTPAEDWPSPSLDPRDAATSLKLFRIAAPRFDIMPAKGKSGQPLPRLSVILDQMTLAGDWLRAPRMTLDATRNKVTVNGYTRMLDPMDFVWLRLLATAAQEVWICDRDSKGQPVGAVTIARLLFGKPAYGRLDDLRRWFDQAILAARAGDDIAQKSAQRTDMLSGASTADDPDTGKNLRAWVLEWQAGLAKAAQRGVGSEQAEQSFVGDEVMRKIGSFTKLRDALAEAFGTPLATTMLPRSTERKRKADGLPQAAYALAAARPGFLTLKDG